MNYIRTPVTEKINIYLNRANVFAFAFFLIFIPKTKIYGII